MNKWLMENTTTASFIAGSAAGAVLMLELIRYLGTPIGSTWVSLIVLALATWVHYKAEVMKNGTIFMLEAVCDWYPQHHVERMVNEYYNKRRRTDNDDSE